MATSIAAQRARACRDFLTRVHEITGQEGITPSTLHALKLKLMALAARSALFPPGDFEVPVSQRRNHPLLVEDNDGHGLCLTINMPAKEAAPHDHGI